MGHISLFFKCWLQWHFPFREAWKFAFCGGWKKFDVEAAINHILLVSPISDIRRAG